MRLRQNHPIETAAAKAGISRATGYRLINTPHLPSQERTPRGCRRRLQSGRLGHPIQAIVQRIGPARRFLYFNKAVSQCL